MRNVTTIAKRELRGYFDTPIAYIVIIFFLLIAGWIFFSMLFQGGRADMRSFFEPVLMLVSPATLMVLVVPAITMRLVAQEKKSGTIELLSTLPITDGEIILGKYFGALGLLMIATAGTLFYAISVATLGDMDWGLVMGGYVGWVLYVAALASLGLLTSTVSNDQIVAFILGLLLCGTFYSIDVLSVILPPSLGAFFQFISGGAHLRNLARGVLDSRDILFYLSVCGGALFLASQSLRRQHA